MGNNPSVQEAGAQYARQEGAQYARDVLIPRYAWCAQIGMLTTVVGIATVIVLWAVGIGCFGLTTIGLGVYLIILAIPVTLLEFSGFISKCACCKNEGVCCAMWNLLLFLDYWKRSVFYVVTAIPVYIMSITFPSIIGWFAALALDVCAVMYLLKTFQYKSETAYVDRGGTGGGTGGTPTGGQPGMQDASNY